MQSCIYIRRQSDNNIKTFTKPLITSHHCGKFFIFFRLFLQSLQYGERETLNEIYFQTSKNCAWRRNADEPVLTHLQTLEITIVIIIIACRDSERQRMPILFSLYTTTLYTLLYIHYIRICICIINIYQIVQVIAHNSRVRRKSIPSSCSCYSDAWRAPQYQYCYAAMTCLAFGYDHFWVRQQAQHISITLQTQSI